ncbi:M20 family peptidase [Rhodococcus rhodnii]|uniref:Peptidase M20 domain-containing protein 2 n=1 Tax=Rhodococcus rhodnii TaxID=38312 RepID=A0A6P2CJU1_9NOCA|nr:M20 family metallopeptidase [Rhodococcus rhodnii]TXG92582.1 M20 family peptidase [Rhodococcus rhodnii]
MTGELVALSRALHAEPELAFEEFRACERITNLLRRLGFEVRTGVAGLPTAFDARFGSGDLEIAVLAEYDALPGIGHACGHNIIAASAVGAGHALARVADVLGITVRVIGTPAEETGGGKVLMLHRGVFDSVAAAVMVHPGPVDIVGAVSLALADVAVEFRGVETHASAAPELGRNAADAATVAQVAVGLLRQHLASDQQIHGIVSDGGDAPNIVPARSEMLYYLRARSAESLADLTRRVEAAFAGAALATGCTHSVRTVSPTYEELSPDAVLAAAYRDEIAALGRTPIPAAAEESRPLGSTDMGNVTRVVPGIHPIIGVESGGAVTHQPQFAAACVGPSAERAIVDGALALAGAIARVATDDVQRARLLDGVARRRSGIGDAGSGGDGAGSVGDGAGSAGDGGSHEGEERA